jgi:hypothetical protein
MEGSKVAKIHAILSVILFLPRTTVPRKKAPKKGAFLI